MQKIAAENLAAHNLFMNQGSVVSTNVIEIDARRIQRAPSARGRARREALRDAEARHESIDPVLRAARQGSAAEVLHVQIVELAREAASLEFDRLQATDPRVRQRISSRRIRALRALAQALLEQQRLAGAAPPEPLVRRVLIQLTADVCDVAQDLFSPELAAQFEARFRESTDTKLEQMIAMAFDP